MQKKVLKKMERDPDYIFIKIFHVSANYSLQVFTVSDTQFDTWKKNLHQREITALIFFNPLKYLITGAADGSSKLIMTYVTL